MKCYSIFCLGVLFVTSVVFGAHFEYDSSLIWTQVGGYAENSTEADPIDDPGTPYRDQNSMSYSDPSSISASMSSTVSTARGSQSSSGDVVYTSDSVSVQYQADASGSSDDADSSAWSYAGCASVQPGSKAGIYFTIIGDGDEAVGDDVTMTVSWFATLSVNGRGSASVDGGFSPDGGIYVTVNDDDDIPGTPETVYHHESVQVGDNETAGPGTSAIITAKVGDTIGIFFGNGVNIALNEEAGSSICSSYAEISLYIDDVTPAFDPKLADFDNNGRVDLADFARFASAWLWQETVNETCEDAEEIELDTHYTGDTSGMIDDSAWYSFTPSISDFYTVSVCQGDDYHLEMYPACGEESFIGTYEDCQFAVWLDSGEDYYMEVIGDDWVEGDYNLFVTRGALIPDNDYCGSAEEFTGEAWAEGTTIGAMGSDEGSCATGDIHDVWYVYTPEQTGDHVFLLHPTFGPFDGVLTVYEGDVCTPLPSELDCVTTDGGEAEIMLSVNAGTSYLVRVASDGVGAGPFGLEIFYVGGEE